LELVERDRIGQLPGNFLLKLLDPHLKYLDLHIILIQIGLLFLFQLTLHLFHLIMLLSKGLSHL
jgi:hypothetical protein